jgi:hypothetical protein
VRAETENAENSLVPARQGVPQFPLRRYTFKTKRTTAT